MTGLRDALAGLPAVARWSLLGAGGLLVALLIGAGGWTFLERRESAARLALATAVGTYRQAMADRGESQFATAAASLREFVSSYPRSSVAAQAWYFLGNVEYERRDYDAALKAFGEAAGRDTGSVGALSRLGTGYAWEAKGNPTRALEAYAEALKGRTSQDFLYAELLLASARAQELLNQPTAAVETYRRLLRQIPDHPRAGDIRIRLGSLQSGA